MFTPAQTVVTRQVIKDITSDPIGAVIASSLPPTDTSSGCEQVSIDLHATEAAGMTVFTVCSSIEEPMYFVEWSDTLGIDNMVMCSAHAEEFIEDAEMNNEITGYVVQVQPKDSPTEYAGYL